MKKEYKQPSIATIKVEGMRMLEGNSGDTPSGGGEASNTRRWQDDSDYDLPPISFRE